MRLLPEGAQSGVPWKEQWLGAQIPGFIQSALGVRRSVLYCLCHRVVDMLWP